MRPRLILLFTIGLTTGRVYGQAFNIDVGGAFSTPPSDAYGAASGQVGYWNAVANLADLRTLDGELSEAEYGATGGSGQFDIPGATGDDELLMESVYSTVPFEHAVSVIGLSPGLYDLYVYCWYGNFVGDFNVGFRVYNGDIETGGEVNFHEQWPGHHVLGETYDVIRFNVLPDERFFALFVGSAGDMALINGLQLVPVPAPSAALPLGAVACWVSRRRR